MTHKLFVERLHEDVVLPKKATRESACFDLRCHIPQRFITLQPDEQRWIGTGLKMDCGEGYTITVHPRSGLSGSKRIKLGNQTGIGDSDYPEEYMVSLWNDSANPFVIESGDRIAQFRVEELVDTEIVDTVFVEGDRRGSDRQGGLGSTGLK